MNEMQKTSLYEQFEACTIRELEDLLLSCESHEEKAFYRALLNLKLQITQEKLIGKVLL